MNATSVRVQSRFANSSTECTNGYHCLERERDTEESDEQKKVMDTSVACYASPFTRVQRTDTVWCRERAEGVGY